MDFAVKQVSTVLSSSGSSCGNKPELSGRIMKVPALSKKAFLNTDS